VMRPGRATGEPEAAVAMLCALPILSIAYPGG